MEDQNVQEPNVQEQNVQEPNVQEPNVQEQNVQEQNVQEQNVQEQNVQEQNVQEPNVQEPNVQEPNVQEPNVQEPNVQEPNVQEPNVQEAAAEPAAPAVNRHSQDDQVNWMSNCIHCLTCLYEKLYVICVYILILLTIHVLFILTGIHLHPLYFITALIYIVVIKLMCDCFKSFFRRIIARANIMGNQPAILNVQPPILSGSPDATSNDVRSPSQESVDLEIVPTWATGVCSDDVDPDTRAEACTSACIANLEFSEEIPIESPNTTSTFSTSTSTETDPMAIEIKTSDKIKSLTKEIQDFTSPDDVDPDTRKAALSREFSEETPTELSDTYFSTSTSTQTDPKAIEIKETRDEKKNLTKEMEDSSLQDVDPNTRKAALSREFSEETQTELSDNYFSTSTESDSKAIEIKTSDKMKSLTKEIKDSFSSDDIDPDTSTDACIESPEFSEETPAELTDTYFSTSTSTQTETDSKAIEIKETRDKKKNLTKEMEDSSLQVIVEDVDPDTRKAALSREFFEETPTELSDTYFSTSTSTESNRKAIEIKETRDKKKSLNKEIDDSALQDL